MWHVVFWLNVFMIVANCASENSSYHKTNDHKEINSATAPTNGSDTLLTPAFISSAKVKNRNKNGSVILPPSKLPLGPTDLYLDGNHGTGASGHRISSRKQALIDAPSEPSVKNTRIDTSRPLQDSPGSKHSQPQPVSASPDEINKLSTSNQNKTDKIQATEPESSSTSSVSYPMEGGPVSVSEHINANVEEGNINVNAKAPNSAIDRHLPSDGDINPLKDNSGKNGSPLKENSVADAKPPKDKSVSDANLTKQNNVSDGNPAKENKPVHWVPKPTVTILTYDKTDIVYHEKTEIYHLNDTHLNQPGIVFPIVLTVAIVPLFAALGFMALRKGREAWKNRHYRRMDFLLDGMYND